MYICVWFVHKHEKLESTKKMTAFLARSSREFSDMVTRCASSPSGSLCRPEIADPRLKEFGGNMVLQCKPFKKNKIYMTVIHLKTKIDHYLI